MKKLVVLVLTLALVLSFASISMASAAFSGEIRVGVKGGNPDGEAASNDWAYGKMVLTGKLGEDLTGTLVYLADDVTSIKVDEASVTFTEDWGALKLGFYGWNNNVKDILDSYTSDIKSQTTVSTSFVFSDALKLGLAYAYTGESVQVVDNWYALHNAFGADLGFAGDNFGLDLMYFNYGEDAIGSNNAWGVNAYLKLGDVKPFIQYRNLNYGSDAAGESSLSAGIIGITYEPAAAPITLRAEVNIAAEGIYKNVDTTDPDAPVTTYLKDKFASAPWGIRFGYKLEDGALIEFQYKATGYNNADGAAINDYYVKLKCPF